MASALRLHRGPISPNHSSHQGETMRSRISRHFAGPLLITFISVPTLYSQCADSNTALYAQTTAIRMNGNLVKLQTQTTVSGDYYTWWQTAVNASFYFNGSLNDNSVGA